MTVGLNVRLTQIDGKLPNLALMKIAHWHRALGNFVHFTQRIRRGKEELIYDEVYGSAIFQYSAKAIETFRRDFPRAVLGGTGTESTSTVEDLVGDGYEHYDYSIYPEDPPHKNAPAIQGRSFGFTQRGCRLKCKFCVVPTKEGKPRSVNTIADIWRSGTPKKIVLLDNDFFGQPREEWIARIRELIDGGFKVNFNQGINIRLIDDEAAYWLARLRYYNVKFTDRRLYTAWDNLKDEKVFFRGIDRLEAAGVPPRHVMVYMLIGFDPTETQQRIEYRFARMVERGLLPYPMVYDRTRTDLKRFQRWVVTGLYRAIAFADYDPNHGTAPKPGAWNYAADLV